MVLCLLPSWLAVWPDASSVCVYLVISAVRRSSISTEHHGLKVDSEPIRFPKSSGFGFGKMNRLVQTEIAPELIRA